MLKLQVHGIVQAVGFRPFIHRIALENNLRGYIANVGDHVEISVEGSAEDIEHFLNDLQNEKPPISEIDRIEKEELPDQNFKTFEVVKSRKREGGESIIPPDIAVCDDCLEELFSPSDRRYMYPFINCTNCGPRFTIIEEIPYDREKTSMKAFPLCEFCQEQYTTITDRRYHAEPVCCPQEGPKYDMSIEKAARLLDADNIVAIKGLGGYHIACRIDNEVVTTLRKALNRPQQPFALMARNIEAVRALAHFRGEENLMESWMRPIVVLPKKIPLEAVAPGLHTIGIMLPYAPVHHILFHFSHSDVFVMTSANFPGNPMIVDNAAARQELPVADAFLAHDLRIVNRCDDSVIRNGMFIRRSRGFVPRGIPVTHEKVVLAVGGELNNTFCITKGRKAFLSQHIGDTSHYDTLLFQKEAISHMMRLLGIDWSAVELIVSDLHPQYSTGRQAEEFCETHGIPLKKVQHHFAHARGLMAEHNQEMVVITADGAGYGLDGNVWGGEILTASERLGHLEYVPMPGGDLATKYPERMLLSYLEHEIPGYRYSPEEQRILLSRLKKEKVLTSSTGRFLDSVAVLTGICYERTYEGEPAMKAESLAMGGCDLGLEMEVEGDAIMVRDFVKKISEINASKKDIARTAHAALGRAYSEVVSHYEDLHMPVGFSGGVAYNEIITTVLRKEMHRRGTNLYLHCEVPPGDGGTSFGQVVLVDSDL
ncbi:MAG: carbamoyltransferase HypF [Theionarchaea archaeon]|nr:carbamoyltransferase HypF [Theionarchaea archaeon]MBU7038422.1 carbamoyltransferase HypF [Theionarchaea archaeon]